MKTIIKLLFLLPLFFSSSLCLAQLADVEGIIRSNSGTPTVELFDNVEARIEARWEEFSNDIYLYSKYGDLKLGAADDGSGRASAFMTLKSDNQRVGINTTNPTSALQVNDAGSDRSIGLGGIVQSWKDGATVLGTMGHVFDAILIQNQKTPTTATVISYGLQVKQLDGLSPFKLIIDGKGEIGLGNFSGEPQAAIHLKHAMTAGASANNEGVRFENEGANGNHFTFYVANTDGYMELYSKEGANAYIATINDVSGAYSSVSDARLKNNIRSLDPVLEKVKQLNPVSYFYNHQKDKKERYSGFLAQELNEQFSEFVAYNAEKDQYGVDYAGLSTVAIKAIQEQQLLIDQQQQEIETLQTELKILENNYAQRFDQIEALINK